MRCPKCGYISFDLVEKCTKCGKNISGAAEVLHGTTTSTDPPVFLKFDKEPEGALKEAAGEEAAAGMEEQEPLDLGEEEEEVFLDFSAEESAPSETETLDMEAGTEPDVAAAEMAAEPSMDISDLAPTEEEAEVEEAIEDAGTEEFALAEEETAEEMEAAHELEDLKVEGIDLEPAPPSGEQGKVMPSVKTGTALDDFDVDLGDLIPKKK